VVLNSCKERCPMMVLMNQNICTFLNGIKVFFLNGIFCLYFNTANTTGRIIIKKTGPSLPKQDLHRVQTSASCLNFQYLRFSLTSFTSCWSVLPRLTVTSIILSKFPSITCFRKQFLRKMWPLQLSFLLFIVCTIFLSSYLISHTIGLLIFSTSQSTTV